MRLLCLFVLLGAIATADVTLSTSKTAATIAIPAAARTAKVIEIAVTGVENPSRAPVTVRLLTTSSHRLVGTLSLYPADQPGVFRFRLGDLSKERSLFLELTKQPVKVTIGGIKWLKDEPTQ